MILDRVTITGADDSIMPERLEELSLRFPFVEWAILLSRSQEGSPRFPSLRWMEDLADVARTAPSLKLSGHLCGAWVRALCRGSNRFVAERPSIANMFRRVQLNFHAEPHDAPEDLLAICLKEWRREEYILQLDGVNNPMLGSLWYAGIRAVPLFDTSGGAGIEPDEWPSPIGDYCGYAGGLHPDLLALQLEHIAVAAGQSRVWIDVETHVRSNDDALFDLAKVEKFLAIAEPWVTRR